MFIQRSAFNIRHREGILAVVYLSIESYSHFFENDRPRMTVLLRRFNQQVTNECNDWLCCDSDSVSVKVIAFHVIIFCSNLGRDSFRCNITSHMIRLCYASPISSMSSLTRASSLCLLISSVSSSSSTSSTYPAS